METVDVVIRIPKEQVERLQRIATISTWGLMNLDSTEIAILNGTVLPKGHGNLKDYDAIKNDYIHKMSVFMSEEERMDLLCTIVDEAEAVVKADKEVENE